MSEPKDVPVPLGVKIDTTIGALRVVIGFERAALRDYIASQALVGLFSSTANLPEAFAAAAYAMADAMLAAREGK